MFINFTEKELVELITNQVEENLHLDYKGAGALEKTDSKKAEISKDVSAFANSDGGVIIYGISEFGDVARKHLPEKIDPIERTIISKEWLEHVINSNIQPKIPELLITPIRLTSSPNHIAYVVSIPKSNTSHQAKDKKYYKRYNFESVAMDDYEIKDIMNRQINPELYLLFSENTTSFLDDVISFSLLVGNKSTKIAKDFKFTLVINEPLNSKVITTNHMDDISNLNPGMSIFRSNNKDMIYKGLSQEVGKISIKLLNDVNKLTFTSTIFANNMEPIINNFEIEVSGGKVQYNLK